MRKPFSKRLLALLLTVTMLVGLGVYTAPAPVSAASRSELEAQLKKLEEQEKTIKKNLSNASSSLSASKERKALLQQQIDNATSQIAVLDKQLRTVNSALSDKNKEIKKTQKEIEAKEDEIANTQKDMGLRLRNVAKTGNLSALQRLLNAENFRDYLLKAKAAEYISQQDRQVMDDLEQKVAELEEKEVTLKQQKDDVAAQKKEVEALKAKSDKKKKELDTLHKAVQSEIGKLQNQVSGYQSELKRTQKQIDEADAAIEALIKASTSTGTYNDSSKMWWPVPAVRAISSHYGPRWGTMHRGLDIANGTRPIYGQDIYAAADGVVIAVNKTSSYGSGWSYGYGYCVIIDHGRDSKGRTIHTMYAHCSSVSAYEGQKVTGGKTIIAKAGATGDVTGPHLHFEVRVDNVRVNPYNTYVHPDVNIPPKP